MNAAMIEVLQQASSQDPNVLKPAEQTLREWETQTGFYTALYNVFSNHSLPVNVRWIALLCFKNGVDKYWRKNAPNGISEEEKKCLRSSLTSNFDEPINQLATHLAVVIGKIARFDCPREWDTLVPRLIEVIQGQNSIAQHRALLTLHHVVKTLASKRLMADRQLFEQLTGNIFNYILNLWNTFTESFLILASNGADELQIQENLEKALLSLRILRKLILGGLPIVSKSQDAMMMIRELFPRAKSCLECRKTLQCRQLQSSDLIEKLEKFIIHMTKVLWGVLEYHPFCYVEFIPASMEFTVFYCFTEAGQPYVFTKFFIQCLNLLKSLLIHKNYRTTLTFSYETHVRLYGEEWGDEDTRNEVVLETVSHLRANFFTPELLKEIITWLVTRYFLLTNDDLELWSNDPETFAVDDSRDSWKYNLSGCTETLFLAFFPQFRLQIIPILVELVQKHYQPVHPSDWKGILLKDSVYLAAGLAASELYDDVDFDQWFSTTLKQELEVEDNNYRIIKRRVCWLIGKWARVKLSNKLRPEVYKMMIKALSPDEDLVVRLEAANTLKQALDDFQFSSEEFLPFIEQAFSLLFKLLKEANECETKMKVLYVLSFMIENIGDDIKPYVEPLSSYLPLLWHISEDHNMLRCAIISTLVHYVKALGTEISRLEPLIVSMIALSCDLKQDAHVYLIEDGLELWLALLEKSRAPNQGLVNLIRYMPSLIDSALDQVTLKPAFCIIEAYILLSPQDFLGEVGSQIIAALNSIMVDLRQNDTAHLIRILDLIIRVSPDQGSQLVQPILGRIFMTAYVNKKFDSLVPESLYIIARILLSSREVFEQVLVELTREIGPDKTSEMVLEGILEAWLEKMSWDVKRLKSLKLLALALCSLLSSASPPVVVQRFPNIITSIVECLNDMNSRNESNNELEESVFVDPLLLMTQKLAEMRCDTNAWQFGATHEARKERFETGDIVRTLCLRDSLQNQLTSLQRCMDKTQFDQMISSLNPDINQQLKEYVSL